MPRTSSAKKALRQNKTNKARNVKTKEAYKKAVKEYRKLVTAKDFTKAKEKLPGVFQILDKAAKRNTITKNTASRLKSRLSRAVARV
ncbi:MAG: 30S ribosomal protein S20 [Patescibacteria group bacterium]